MGDCTHSHKCITSDIPFMNTESGKTAFTYYAPHRWNKLQDSLKLDKFLTLEQIKLVLNNVLYNEWSCFSSCVCFVTV